MLRITEVENRLEIEDLMSRAARILIFLLSLIPLLAPYELIIVPDWRDYFNFFFLLCSLISIGAMAVTAFFMLAAVAGLDKRTRFDKLRGVFTHIESAPIIRIKQSEHPLDSIKSVEIETHEWSDGGPSYSLKIEIIGGRSFSLGSSWSREVVENIKNRIYTFLDLS